MLKAFKAQNTPTQLHPNNFKPPNKNILVLHPRTRVFSQESTGGPIQRNCTNAVLCEDLCSPRFQRSKMCFQVNPLNLVISSKVTSKNVPCEVGVLPGTHWNPLFKTTTAAVSIRDYQQPTRVNWWSLLASKFPKKSPREEASRILSQVLHGGVNHTISSSSTCSKWPSLMWWVFCFCCHSFEDGNCFNLLKDPGETIQKHLGSSTY